MAGYIKYLNEKKDEDKKNLAKKVHHRLMPKRETLAEHLQHCDAKPGECPFLKASLKADVIPVGDVSGDSPALYGKLAQALTTLTQLQKSIEVDKEEADSPAAIVSAAITEGFASIKEILEKHDCRIESDEKDGAKINILPPKTDA